jgi:hypothetical protein
MPSPFPGMDPYLETPDLWPDVHHGFINEIQKAINPQITPKYVARVEIRDYVESDADLERYRTPDLRIESTPKPKPKSTVANGALLIAEPVIVASLLSDQIEEAYLTIKHRESKALVAVLEVMSASNKASGSEGRKSFMEKRREVLASEVHWIEIDLLRDGRRANGPSFPSMAYRVLVARGDDRGLTRCWPISLRQRLPVIGIPLKGSDPDVPLNLSAVLDSVYEVGAYDCSVDYAKPPDPPLAPADAKWANKLLRAKGLR